MTFTRHTITGSVELNDGTVHTLDIAQARPALEEGRSPYAQLDLSGPLPDSAVVEKIDVRSGLRGQFTLRSDYGEGSPASAFSAAFGPRLRTTAHAWTGASDASTSIETVDSIEQRRNLFTNPAFTASLTGYTATAVTLSRLAITGTTGTAAVLTPNSTSNGSWMQYGTTTALPAGLVGGRTYTVSASVTTPVAQTDPSALARKIYVIGSGLSIGSDAGPATGTGRVSVTFTLPASPTGLAIYFYNGASNAAGNVVAWDSLLLEEAATARPYFDGSSGTTSALGPAAASDVTAAYAGKLARDFSADYFTPWNSFGVRSPTLRNFNLTLRSRVADHRSGELTLVFNSDEMLLQDFALVSRNAEAPTTATIKGAVQLALGKIGAALSPGSLDATVDDIESLNWLPGVTAWDYVEPLVQKSGLRLYCDEQRVWRLVEPQKSVDGFLSLSAENNVTRGTDEVSLDARSEDSFYDAVVVEYKWTDALGVQQTAYDLAGEASRARKVYTVRYSDVPYPGAGAATAILRRSQGRGRVLNVDAISDYSTEPGLPLGISLPNSVTQTGYVSAVDWDFPEGLMSVKSRGLVETSSDSWALVPPELTWATIAADTTWTNYPNIPISEGA